MRGPRLLIGLVAVAVVSAIAAATIPAGAYASRIEPVRNLGAYDGSSQVVDVDGRDVTINALEGFFVTRTSESGPPPRVDIRMSSTGGYSGFLVSITAGPGPRAGREIGVRDGRAIYIVDRGHGVSWEVVPGATLTVRSRDGSQAQLVDVINAIET